MLPMVSCVQKYMHIHFHTLLQKGREGTQMPYSTAISAQECINVYYLHFLLLDSKHSR